MFNRVVFVFVVLFGFAGFAKAELTPEQDAGIKAYQAAYFVWQCKEIGYFGNDIANKLSLYHSKASFELLGIMGPHPALQSAIEDQINYMNKMPVSELQEACEYQVSFYNQYVK